MTQHGFDLGHLLIQALAPEFEAFECGLENGGVQSFSSGHEICDSDSGNDTLQKAENRGQAAASTRKQRLGRRSQSPIFERVSGFAGCRLSV